MSEPATVGGPRLIAGLGNPGRRYRETRHNLGFRVVDELARRLQTGLDLEQCNARVGERDGVVLAAPQTFMNRSGHSVRCLVDLRSVALESVLIVYDDVHLPLGRLRLRPEGGPGGHRGMESIVENLRTVNVPRLRLGVGPRVPAASLPADLSDLVLSPFAADEVDEVLILITAAADAAEHWLREGIGPAMNRYNR